MKRLALHSLRAAFDVAIWRYGWGWWIAALALAGAAVFEGLLTPAQLSELQRLQSSRTEPLASPAPPAKNPVASLLAQAAQVEGQLQAQGDFDSQMHRVVDIAARHGIVLKRGEYVTTKQNAGGPARMQVGLGVVARYPQFRAFAEDVLRQCPAVSLDRFSLKRDKVEQGQAEIQVTLSFWQAVPSTEPAPPVTVAAKDKP